MRPSEWLYTASSWIRAQFRYIIICTLIFASVFFWHVVIPEVVFPEEDTSTYIVDVTDPVTFVCRARVIPVPIITWNRGGLPLTGTDIESGDANNLMFGMEDLNSRTIVEPPSLSLVITPGGNVYEAVRNLTVYNTMGIDTGTYTCEADNGVQPNDTQDFELFVQGNSLLLGLLVCYNCNPERS